MPRSRAVDETVKSAAANPSPCGAGQEGLEGRGQAWDSAGRRAEIILLVELTPSPPPRPSPQGRGAGLRHVHRALPHDSAAKHVQGAADYIDDIREPEGTLHVAVGSRRWPAGALPRLILERSAPAPGVVAVLTAADIPGKNDVAPAFGDDPLFADDEVSSAARRCSPSWRATRDAARRAARLAAVEIEGEAPSVTIEDALGARRNGAAGLRLRPRRRGGGDRGRAAPARGRVPRRRPGAFLSRRPGRARRPGRGRRRCIVYSSTQHPSEVQHLVATRARRADDAVTVRDPPHGRRLRRQGEPGGAMGGARGARRARDRPAVQAAARPRRRHRSSPASGTISASTSEVGFDDDGAHRGLEVEHARPLRLLGRPVAAASSTARCSTPTTPTSCRRRASPRSGCKTNTVSNTAFRGFGGPQGMLVDRAGDRRDRLGARPRSARRPQAQFLRRTAATSRPISMTVEDNVILPSSSTSWSATSRLPRAARGDRAPSTRRARSSSAASR